MQCAESAPNIQWLHAHALQHDASIFGSPAPQNREVGYPVTAPLYLGPAHLAFALGLDSDHDLSRARYVMITSS